MLALSHCLKIQNSKSNIKITHISSYLLRSKVWNFVLLLLSVFIINKNVIYCIWSTTQKSLHGLLQLWAVKWGVMEWEHKDCWTHWGELGPIQHDICDGRVSFNNPKDKTIRPLHSSPTSHPGSHREAELQNRGKSHVDSGAQKNCVKRIHKHSPSPIGLFLFWKIYIILAFFNWLTFFTMTA